jgi:hypothetical protein
MPDTHIRWREILLGWQLLGFLPDYLARVLIRHPGTPAFEHSTRYEITKSNPE